MNNSYYSGPVSDHFDGVQFYNPGQPTTDKTVSDLLRWHFTGKKSRWPKQVPAISGVKPQGTCEHLRVTHIGHASLLIQVSGVNVLVDPVWSERASPFSWVGPRRRNPPAIRIDDLPVIHGILITHNHYDHCDIASIRTLTAIHKSKILTPFGNDVVLRRAIPNIDVATGDWWDRFIVAGHLKVSIVPANHWSSRGLRDRRMALWGGFVLETANGAVYCVGDTGYGEGKIFRRIRERFGPPVVAAVPIGAYAPRWFMKEQHTDPADAVRLGRDCGALALLGIHWGTFALTDESFDEPARRFRSIAFSGGYTPEAAVAFRPGEVWSSADQSHC